MKSIHQWFDEYAVSHQSAVNKAIHWICIPAIMVSLAGLLWSVPLRWGFLNCATAVMLLSCIYTVVLSPRLAVGMTCAWGLVLLAIFGLAWFTPVPLVVSCTVLFAAAWGLQIVGHRIEGKRPSFLQDVQFLFIGPLWLLSKIYGLIGIEYAPSDALAENS